MNPSTKHEEVMGVLFEGKRERKGDLVVGAVDLCPKTSGINLAEEICM